MNTRHCGYCRAVGHNTSACQHRLGIIDTIRRHVGAERLAISQAIIKSGYGVGAIVTGYSYSGGTINCLVTQENLDEMFRYECDTADYRPIKYSKRVRVSLYHKLTPRCDDTSDDIYRYVKNYVSLPVTPLEIGVERATAQISVDVLGSKNAFKQDYWSVPSQILSPSYDGEISKESMNMKFRLAERLSKDLWTTPIF